MSSFSTHVLDAALDDIAARIRAAAGARRPLVVGLSGAQGSGK